MARGKKASYEDKIAKLTKKIEEVNDKRSVTIKKLDEQLKQLNEEKKQLIVDANAAKLDGLVGIMDQKGLTIERLAEIIEKEPARAE